MMFRRILKWVLWTACLILMILLLVAAGLFFLPNLVSTHWARHQLETRASQSLHRAVTLRDLQWRWTEGIRIKGFQVADTPRYGTKPILSVDELLVLVDFELAPRRLIMNVKADGLKANLVREKDGRTNLEAWLTQLKPPSRPAQSAREGAEAKTPAAPFMLPGDLTARIRMTHARLYLEDRMENRSLRIQEGALSLDMPSLLSKPVTLTISSEQSLDEKILPPLELAVHVGNLVNDTGALVPKAATLDVKGELPGLHVSLQGAMAQKGLEGAVKMDLAPLAEAAKPLMPATLPRLSGTIALETKARLQTDDTVIFDVTLTGDNIKAAGGPLEEKEIGPFSVSLSQKGSAALHDKTVTLEEGHIRLLKKSGLSLKGRMKLESGNRMAVNLNLEKVDLHLPEIQALAKGFIPEGIQLAGADPASPPVFKAKHVQLNGTLPDGEADLMVEDMALTLPRLQLALSKDSIKLEDLVLSAPRTTVRLKDRFPETLETQLSLGAKHVGLSGNKALTMDECEISSLKVTVKDLRPSTRALWGMAGGVTVEESGVFRGVHLPPHDDGTDRLAHSFKAHVDLPQAARAGLSFAEANLTLAPLKLSAILPHPLEEGMTLKSRLKDVRITQLEPFKLDVAHLEADLHSGDVLALHLQGSASDSGIKSFQTQGRLSMDAGQALTLAPAAIKPKGEFTGRVETEWQFQGRRPTEEEMVGLTDQSLTLEKRLGHTQFLEKLALKTELIDMGAVLPLDSGGTLSARGIRSVAPLSIGATKGLSSLSLGGELKVDDIEGAPSLKKLKNPLGAQLSFNAESRNLNSLELRETLQMAPLGLSQNLELSLNKLNHLLRQKEKPSLAALLKTVEARIKAGIRVNTGPGLAPLTRGVNLEGPLNGTLSLQLRGGRSVSLRTNLDMDGIDGALPNKFSITNLKTHLQFEKTYGLAFGLHKEKTRESAKALSRSVLQPEASFRHSSSAANPLSQRLLEDLRGRLTGKPTFSFTEARLDGGPFPMLLKNAQMEMRLRQSLPSVDYFQMGVMGGTVLGSMRILEEEDRYRLEMTGDFSGLDASRLLSKQIAANSLNPTGNQEDTQISGRMSLRVPVTAQAGDVMGSLDALFRLTHIGARTLERLLYAMDPHENNESIVRQRALLKKGTPRWIEVLIRNGNLSLTGEVALGGSTIQLPAIRRLNVASLPIKKQIQTLADRLAPLLKGLNILSANTIWVGPDGTMDFREDVK